MRHLENVNKQQFSHDILGTCLTSLPNNQPSKAAILLLQVLEGVSMQTMNTEKWLSITKRIQPTLNRIRSSSYQQIWRDETETFTGNYDLSDVSLLHLRLAIDSTDAALELANGLHSNRDMDKLVQMLNSALVFWYLYQLDCALSYQNFPIEYWLKIHKLFSVMCQLKLPDYPVIPLHERTFSTLGELYKRILLLDAINPARFMRRELLILDRLLLSWSKYVQIHEGLQEESQFVLQLQAQAGLQYANMELRLSTNIGVNVNHLVRLLNCWGHYANKADTGMLSLGEVELSQDCLHRILHVFVQKPVRRYRRMPQVGAIEVQKNLLGSDRSKTEWRILNTSAHGYCLEKPINENDAIAVGQLIQLQELSAQVQQAPAQQWSIAVIRWVNKTPEGQWQMGIQLLSPAAIHVKLAGKRQHAHGLLLPEVDSLGQTASVIVNVNQHKKGDVVDIKDRDSQYRVQLINLLTQGQNFQQFACRIVS